MSESIHKENVKLFIFISLGLGEYFCALGQGDFNRAILASENTMPV